MKIPMPVGWLTTPVTSLFYERTRTETLRHHHFSQQVLLAERVAFVARKMTLEYFAPARLDDMLEVQTEITSMRGTSLVFTQRIVNAKKHRAE